MAVSVAPVVSTGNGSITNSARLGPSSSMDGDIGLVHGSSKTQQTQQSRVLSPPSINQISLSASSSHVVASTTITNLDAQSQKFKLVSEKPLF